MSGRRGPGEGSVYQRADGRWFGVVDLGWQNGKRLRKTVSARTKAATMAKFRAMQKDLEAGIVRDGSTTVEAWLTYWLDEIAARRVRPSTLTTYKGYANSWLIPHLGKHRLDRLTPEHARALYRLMEREGKKAATIRQVHAILRRALQVAQDEGKILRNPVETIELPRPDGSHGRLDLDEAKRVVAALDGHPRASRWLAALLLALRQGEALGLAWEDVDLLNGRVHIRQAQVEGADGSWTLGPVKSASSDRSLRLIGPLQALLTVEKAAATGPLVWGPMEPWRDYNEWQGILRAAGVAKRPVHAARATTASLLAELRVSDKIVSEILGHAGVQVTQRHYIHGSDSAHADALAGLAGLLTGDVVTPRAALPSAETDAG